MKTSLNEFETLTQAGMFLVYLPLNALLLCLTALIFRRYGSRLTARDWLLYALFPVSQLILVESWYELLIVGPSAQAFYFQLAALLICIAADIALYFSIRGMAQRAELQAEKAILEKQIDAQREHYAALTGQYENVRRMRHDIENHMHTIHILLQNGRTEEAAEYASELQGRDYRSSLGSCRHPVVDAFLYNRAEELRGQGVEVTADVSLPAWLHIANADLISAFGNLVDNAAEACRGAAEKRILLRARLSGGYLLIDTENPAAQPDGHKKERRIQELERGVGFHILRDLAQKYGGEFSAGVRDGLFRASLTLREGDEYAENSDM